LRFNSTLQVIQKIYGNNSEIVELFRKNPGVVSKVVLERVQAKVKIENNK